MLKAKKAENNKIIKSGFLGFCRGKYEASGCFIGGEVGLAITDNWFWFNNANLPLISNETLTPNKTTLNVPINLIFGYQWYYMQNQGLRVKANIGYTNYNVDFKIKYQENTEQGESQYKFNNNALQYGLELAWLWDFMRKGKHTLGLDLGAGFEASTFFNNSNVEGSSVNVNDTKFAFNFRTGLHYYFNVNHQIGLAYSYKTYTTINGVGIKLKENNNVELGKLATSPRNQILLSYAYKF